MIRTKANPMGLFFKSPAKPLAPEWSITGRKQYVMGSLLILVFFLLPMYIFPSGGYQLVDLPMIFIFLWALLHRNEMNEDLWKRIGPLIPLVIWVCLVNSFYFLIYPKDYWYLLSAAVVVYGFMLLYSFSIIFLNIINKKDNIIFLYLALLLSIIGCFIIKGYSEEGRATLSFNNPNQLAYFAVILCSYGILLVELIEKNNRSYLFIIINIMVIIVSYIFGLLSLSRAGVFALLILGLYLIISMRSLKLNIIMGFALLFIGLICYYKFPEFIKERLAIRTDRQWSIDELIYGKDGIIDRIYRPLKSLDGIEILIGKGAGLLKEREELKKEFGKFEIVMEVHNMFMSVLRNYGLIGLLLLVYWSARFFWNSLILKSGGWIMFALFIYNFGHDGIRFRSFWILLAFLNAMIYLAKRTREKQATHRLQRDQVLATSPL